ncbi:MAG: hypothetical protein K0S47_131 [Herbinix sp.]|jgi:hypothetical protein|nr:hypothetical protein [Herbinix sp.]
MLYDWIYQTNISNAEYRMFTEASQNVGCCLRPIAIARQNLSRYRFMCISSADSNAPAHFLIIEVYNPREGPAYVTQRLPLNIDI